MRIKIPEYLKAYTVEQHYDEYTPREHSTRRYIMRQSRNFFAKHGHPFYLKGLEETGITIRCIPDVAHMNEKLNKFAWGAVCVRGFIPPLAFLDFQSRGILPIAADMRTLEHISYTPAPDIVHEAAGHAPFIAHDEFREYLTHYAKLARKAIFSTDDIKLYEAIRQLSDVKENPDYNADEINDAEKHLEECAKNIHWISEANHISRLYWWTAEYGLIESKDKPLVYGAGLLSSLGESQDALAGKALKKALTFDCIHQEFDITRPQPQLFVAKDFAELTTILKEFEKNMCFRVGGLQSLEKAKQAKTVTTTELDSKVGVSGIVDRFEKDKEDQVAFIAWQGPVQLSFAQQELQDQGYTQHPHGFSCPIGKWKHTTKNPQQLSDLNLAQLGIKKNQTCELYLASGFLIKGFVKDWVRSKEDSLVLITWTNCTVTLNDKVYFAPDWGVFDMLVGTQIVSVYGGPADFARYESHDIGRATTSPKRKTPYTKKNNNYLQSMKKSPN